MNALRDAFVQKLQATAAVTTLATGGVWPGLPPEDAADYPFITVTAQDAPKPERVFRGGGSVADEIAFESATYLVKAIDKSTSPKAVGDINTQIRTALDGQTITVTGYTLINLIWQGDLGYVEEADGQIYQHEGGLYQIWAKKT